MASSAIWWVIAVSSSLVGGVALVGVLVARRRWEPIAAAVVVVCGMAGAYSLAAIGQAYARVDAAFYALAFELAALGGGYALASTLLHKLVKPLHAPVVSEASPVDARAAVIVACCVEPPHYDPRATAGMLQSLTDEGLLDLSIGGQPFLFFAHKTRYRSLNDISPSLEEIVEVARRLHEALPSDVAVTDWAGCSGDGRLANKVAAAVRRGHRRIIVSELSVATSVHMEAALTDLDSLELGEARVVRTERVTDSETVPDMMVERISTAIHGAGMPGVVLVGHGQPEQRAKSRPEFEEAETVFLSRLRVLLTESGIQDEHVRTAWAEWNEPGVTQQVRHLAALGCDRIVVAPAVFPVDTLSTRLDLKMAAEQAHLDRSVEVITLPGWGADDAVVAELARLALEALEDLPAV